jgi:hypothetical protein
MGGQERAANQHPQLAAITEAVAIETAKAEAENQKAAQADPCACANCGRTIDSGHSFLIRRYASAIGDLTWIEHDRCDSPIAPENPAGKKIDFAVSRY